ncbi:MAG: DJ-1/PfpI family protein [Candidatus Bathyarchaeota archaeon]|nr:MAG: DJ-1/PfpI family protein [Candidatus Bathyarchaeota archaeon]
MDKYLKSLLLLAFAIVLIIGGSSTLNRSDDGSLEGVEVLALVADGFDYKEFSEVKARLQSKGARVTAASFEAGMLQGDGGEYSPETTFDEIDAMDYDAFFIPGGNSPYNLIHHRFNVEEGHQTALDILTQAHEERKLIAAICHGPWVLAAADLVNGTRVTCYIDPYLIADLEKAGAVVDTGRLVVRDGLIITGFGWDAIESFASEIVRALSSGAE